VSQLALPELFEEDSQKDRQSISEFFLSLESKNPVMPPQLAGLFELSADAYYSALYAIMSELPIEKEISGFIKKVEEAGSKITNLKSEEARAAANRAAYDRGDPNVLVVLKTAGRVLHEIHRLTGLLRFKPDNNMVYIARCAPDHFILPALAEHFTLRFGETSWAIIDEKRKLCLCREKASSPRIIEVSSALSKYNEGDNWEDLWRLYYHSVNNEARKNTRLRQQFMPGRYQKYLTEMEQPK